MVSYTQVQISKGKIAAKKEKPEPPLVVRWNWPGGPSAPPHPL